MACMPPKSSTLQCVTLVTEQKQFSNYLLTEIKNNEVILLIKGNHSIQFEDLGQMIPE